MRGHNAVIEAWCNGSTSDFGSDSLGSNPDASTNQSRGWFLLENCVRRLLEGAGGEFRNTDPDELAQFSL